MIAGGFYYDVTLAILYNRYKNEEVSADIPRLWETYYKFLTNKLHPNLSFSLWFGGGLLSFFSVGLILLPRILKVVIPVINDYLKSRPPKKNKKIGSKQAGLSTSYEDNLCIFTRKDVIYTGFKYSF